MVTRYADYPDPTIQSQVYITRMEDRLQQDFRTNDMVTYMCEELAIVSAEDVRKWNLSADAINPVSADYDAMVDLLETVGQTAPPGATLAELKQQFKDAWIALSKDTPEYAAVLAKVAAMMLDTIPTPVEVGIDKELPRDLIYIIPVKLGDWVTTDDQGDPVTIPNTRIPYSPAELKALRDWMNDPNVRPSRKAIWLDYVAIPFLLVEYKVNGTVRYKIANPSPQPEVEAKLKEEMLALETLKTEINTFDLECAIKGIGEAIDARFTLEATFTSSTPAKPTAWTTTIPRDNEPAISYPPSTSPITYGVQDSGEFLARHPAILYRGSIGTITYTERTR